MPRPASARLTARATDASRQVKVVVTGAYGAGKTTFVQAMSEIPVLSTERPVSDAAADADADAGGARATGGAGASDDARADRAPEQGRAGPTEGGKRRTTVAMDFGRLTIDRDLVLYLFGTPGQRRFEFMWQILAEGMLGFVVLVDGGDEDTFGEAAEMLAYFRDAADVPFVVAVNKGDGLPDGGVGEVRERLALSPRTRCVAVDARDRESVKGVLLELLYAAVEDLDDEAAVV